MPASQGRLPKGGLTVIIAMSITQLVGWGTTFNFPTVLARPMAAELGMSLSTAFAAPTAFLIAFALVSPFLAPLYLRIGAGPILIAGSLAGSVSLLLLSQCTSPLSYFALWALLGASGTMMLATAAHTRLTEMFGSDARQWITVVMLVTGLSVTIGYPATQYLNDMFGWRQTIIIFALLNLLLCLPLHVLAAMQGRRSVAITEGFARRVEAPPPRTPRETRIFLLLCLALSIGGFLSWGLFVVIIELFRANGLTPLQALSIASALGPIQVAARFLELIVARHMAGLLMSVIASGVVPLAFVILLLGGETYLFGMLFMVVYGTATGALAVGRVTLPLELFGPKTYGYQMSRMNLPLYLSFAAGAPALMAIIEFAGARMTMWFCLGISLCGFASMLGLRLFFLHSPEEVRTA